MQKEYDIKNAKEEYKKALKAKDEEILRLGKKVTLLLDKIKSLDNKIYINSFNEENMTLNKRIIQNNNDIVKNKTTRGYITSNTFRKNSKKKK